MADSFSYEQLIASGEGRLFNADSGRLPLPPMLMFDRITHIDSDGGAHGLGKSALNWTSSQTSGSSPATSRATRHARLSGPGCHVAAHRFYLTWLQLPGRGRALGAGEVKFTGEVGPT